MPTDLSANEIEVLLDQHLVRIVNGFRDTAEIGNNDRRVDLMAAMYGVPPWLVLRIGRDAGLLTDAEKARFEAL